MNRKLGVIGMSPGNGHPYSWSAIFNGYETAKMADCPFPAIPEYLAEVDPAAMFIEGAKVTHIWTQERKISEHIAGASRIENVVDDITDLIGQVDAVLLARDDGENHLRMAAPFIEADIPILIDKPLTDNLEDLRQFVRYYEAGKTMMSCSSMRYVDAIHEAKEKVGSVLTAHALTGKYWRTYGIHIIEAVYAMMGTGVTCVQNVGREGEEIVHMQYADGRHAVLQSFKNIAPAFHFGFYGDKGSMLLEQTDAYTSFKNMLTAFVDTLKSGKPAFDWHETVETVKVVIAAIISLREDGRIVYLKEID
ncbi:MAG: Gfo/Idh/MocA family oxidoreductase [Thermoplasmata archaeon]|nr:Gfo/Idh/MocA family oxidoreductase [Thermoplasmata archaeon]